jgi:hypothetical protein
MLVLVIGVSVWFVVEVAKLHLDNTPMVTWEYTVTAQKFHHVIGRYRTNDLVHTLPAEGSGNHNEEAGVVMIWPIAP